ncbi:MAG: hypothetical protein AB8E15_01610 [Bdellovibrionales bacterium]
MGLIKIVNTLCFWTILAVLVGPILLQATPNREIEVNEWVRLYSSPICNYSIMNSGAQICAKNLKLKLSNKTLEARKLDNKGVIDDFYRIPAGTILELSDGSQKSLKESWYIPKESILSERQLKSSLTEGQYSCPDGECKKKNSNFLEQFLSHLGNSPLKNEDELFNWVKENRKSCRDKHLVKYICEYKEHISQAAESFEIHPALLTCLTAKESQFNEFAVAGENREPYDANNIDRAIPGLRTKAKGIGQIKNNLKSTINNWLNHSYVKSPKKLNNAVFQQDCGALYYSLEQSIQDSKNDSCYGSSNSRCTHYLQNQSKVSAKIKANKCIKWRSVDKTKTRKNTNINDPYDIVLLDGSRLGKHFRDIDDGLVIKKLAEQWNSYVNSQNLNPRLQGNITDRDLFNPKVGIGIMGLYTRRISNRLERTFGNRVDMKKLKSSSHYQVALAIGYNIGDTGLINIIKEETDPSKWESLIRKKFKGTKKEHEVNRHMESIGRCLRKGDTRKAVKGNNMTENPKCRNDIELRTQMILENPSNNCPQK